MIRPIEKTLFLVILAGGVAMLLMVRTPGSTERPSVASTPALSAADTSVDLTPLPASVADSSVVRPVAGPESEGDHGHAHGYDHQHPVALEGVEVGEVGTVSPATMIRVDPEPLEIPPSTAPVPSTAVSSTESASSGDTVTNVTGAPQERVAEPAERERSSIALEEPRRCSAVEELWVADGYPVEDPCTRQAVQQALLLAWTGTDDQRRKAIRNGHLLDEVFAALDDFARDYNGRLFHPEHRGGYTLLFKSFQWRGGPDAEDAVIAVEYGFDHPVSAPPDVLYDTLVQVDGEWKVSYRRSFCVRVLAIMEYIGSDVRCPPDPHPEVNEDESPLPAGGY